MALNTAKYDAIQRDFTKKFRVGVDSAKVFYPSICTDVTSTGADEKYGWLGSIPGVREWLGDRQFKELRAADYTLANKKWEDSLLIPKDNIADDRMGFYDMVLPDLGRRAAQHPDKLVFDLIKVGKSTACFDGQYFFDTDHSWGDSGTQDNDLTYAAATGTVPTVDEFRLAVEASIAAIQGFKDDSGEPFMQPTIGGLSDLMVIVPLALRATAKKAFEFPNVQLTSSANRVVDDVRVVVSPFLTDATEIYTLYLGSMLKPFVFQMRQGFSNPVLKGKDDVETKDLKFMVDARYNVGYLAWWNACLTTFT